MRKVKPMGPRIGYLFYLLLSEVLPVKFIVMLLSNFKFDLHSDDINIHLLSSLLIDFLYPIFKVQQTCVFCEMEPRK